MKSYVSGLTLVFGLILFQVARAQEITCDQFCVEGIQMDTANPGIMIITIYFGGESNDFINYPHVDFVLDQQGDTIADGDLAFFGQIGMTRLDYYVSTSLAAIPDNFHAIVYFRYDDTLCTLSFPCTTSSTVDSESFSGIRIFPNPISSETNIAFDRNPSEITMIIFNPQGKRVGVVSNLSKLYKWQPGNLPQGIYTLQFISNHRVIGIEKVIKAD